MNNDNSNEEIKEINEEIKEETIEIKRELDKMQTLIKQNDIRNHAFVQAYLEQVDKESNLIKLLYSLFGVIMSIMLLRYLNHTGYVAVIAIICIVTLIGCMIFACLYGVQEVIYIYDDVSRNIKRRKRRKKKENNNDK